MTPLIRLIPLCLLIPFLFSQVRKSFIEDGGKPSLRTVLIYLLHAALTPGLLFEYFALYWFCFGGGAFETIGTLTACAALLWGFFFLRKKLAPTGWLLTFFNLGGVILIPIIAIYGIHLLAWLCGVRITVA